MISPPHTRILAAISAVIMPLVAAFGAPVVLDRSQSSQAEVVVISETPRETVLELRFSSVDVDTVHSNRQAWTSLSVPGMSLTSRAGWPELPQTSVWIRGSERARIEVTSSEHTSHDWGRIQPAPDPALRSMRGLIARNASDEFYSGTAEYPEALARLSQNAVLRGTRVALVTFTPIQFDPVMQRCVVHTRLRVRIVHEANGSLDRDLPVNGATQTILERLLMTNAHDSPADAPGSARVLLVTEPQFVGALQPFIGWKTRAGLPVQVVMYSEVASTAEQLRARLIHLCDSLPAMPDYLLIVGDVDVVPAFFGVEGSLTDHPYSMVSGSDDYLPDISVGRLPCHTPLECTNWVDRILAYERDGQMISTPDATVFSSAWARDPQHGIVVRNLFQAAGLATDHLQEPQSGSLQQLTNSLNAGREWVFYIGHGYAQGWTSVSPALENSHIPSLQSSAASVVVSVACATAHLNYPGGCFGESWLDGANGPLAYFGATEPTPFFYSDTLGLGTMRAVFDQHVDRLGLAADLGRLATAQAFPQPPGGLTEETIQQFMLLGDPSMRVFASVPQVLTVSYSQTVPIGVPEVVLTVQSNDQAVSNAEVCVSSSDGSYYAVHSTDAAGTAAFALDLAFPTVLNVTATGRNAIPYLGTLSIAPASGAFLQLAGLNVSDEDGDSDGRADRGESCELRIAVTNVGNAASSPGTARMASSDPRIQIQNGDLSLPSLMAGDTSWLDGSVPFTVADTASDLSSALVRVDLRPQDGDSTTAYHGLTLHAPVLSPVSASLFDDPENDQQVSLVVQLRNVGSDHLHPAQIHLTSLSSGVSVPDSVRDVAAVAEGDILSVTFALAVLPDLPHGYPFEFSYAVTAQNLPSQSHYGMQRLAQIPCFLYQLDRRPEPIDAIAAALMSLDIGFERDTVLPADLNQYGSVWTFCGVFPNQQPLPYAVGQRLADYLMGGGNCYLEGGDTWAFDSPTPVHPLFHIVGVQDGTSNAGPFLGEFGTQYQDFGFEYYGENSFIDQLAPGEVAWTVLRNDRPNAAYPVCIAYAGENYRTVGCSIELGAMSDAAYPSTRVHLVSNILDWFGIESHADIYPPQIQHRPLRTFRRVSRPIPIVADVQDASGVSTVEVIYHVNGGGLSSVLMFPQDGCYRASLPGALSGDTVFYRIRAEDDTPIRTWAQTADYACLVGSNVEVPCELDFSEVTRMELMPRIEPGDNGSWSLVSYPDTATMLELHGAPDETIAFTTPEFDCAQLSSLLISFKHYLRLSRGSADSFARVQGSVDGGVTFPTTVWQSFPEDGHSQEGTVVADNQRWAAGHSAVVLRFEFRSDWYWRIGNIGVSADATPATAPVTGLTISVVKDVVRLHWPRDRDATYYVVSASSSGESEESFVPIASTRDTTFTDLEAQHHNFRLYRVHTIAGDVPLPLSQPAVIRDADVNWNRKLERLRR